MLPGDAGIVQNRIGGFTPPQNIFPVGQGDTAAPRQAQLGPDLRRVGDPQQGPDGPHQNQRRKHRKQQPCNGRVPAGNQRMGTQPQGQRRKQFLHPIPSFPKKQLQTEPAESVSVSRKSGLL